MRSFAAARAPLLSALALAHAGCTALYDFDALDSATVDCGDLASCQKLSTDPCLGVYVPALQHQAYVTRAATDGRGGLYRIDLTAASPAGAETPIYTSRNAAAGVVSDGVSLVFSVRKGMDGNGTVLQAPLSGHETKDDFHPVASFSFGDPTGVGIDTFTQNRAFVQDGNQLVVVDKSQVAHTAQPTSAYSGLRAVAPVNEFVYAAALDDTKKGSVYRFMTDDIFMNKAGAAPGWSQYSDVQSIHVIKAVPAGAPAGSAVKPHVLFSGKDGAWSAWQEEQGSWPMVPTQLGDLQGCPADDTGGDITTDITPPDSGDLQVYWTYRSGCVLRAPIHGGKPTVLTRTLQNPAGIAVVSGTVYVCTDAGLVRLTPK